MGAELCRRTDEGPLARDRVEEKFLFDAAAADALEALAARHLTLRRWTVDAETQVTSVYLDRDDELLSSMARRAPATSMRLRVKAYLPANGDAAAHVPCVLEIKRHRRERTLKNRVWVDRAVLESLCLRRLAVTPPELRAFVLVRGPSRLHPVAVASYRRRVWEAGESLRITLDREVRWHRPDDRLVTAGASLARESLPEAVGGIDGVVVEVKHDGAPLPDWLAEALAPTRRLRGFSKFVSALAAVSQPATERIRTSC